MKEYGNKLRKRNKFANKKVNFLFLLMLFLVIGYALLQAKIQGSGGVNIATGAWNIYLDNLVVEDGSVEAISPAIINNTDRASVSFKVELSDIDDYYEFEVDVVNGGRWDAMITEINMKDIPGELSKYFIYTLTYSDNQELTVNQLLAAGEKERIKVMVKFNDAENLVDLLSANSPYKDLLFNLNFEIVFSQVTEDAVEREKDEIIKNVQLLGVDMIAYMDDVGSEYVEYESGIDFTKYSSETNGRGLYIYSGTEKNKYPIYYYRGAVTDNNVLFAESCWKIVRTTETGGVKLIYSGSVTSDNKCTNTSYYQNLNKTKYVFNQNYNNAKYIGYMYDGSTSSYIKGIIDNWYKNYIYNKNLSSYLEDTIWCADRTSIIDGNKTLYSTYDRLVNKLQKPVLECPQKEDSYTAKGMSNPNGNELLDYPIALLTADEAVLGGCSLSTPYGYDSYLKEGYFGYWLMTPAYWDSSENTAYMMTVSSLGTMLLQKNVYPSADSQGNRGIGIRPSISLKTGTKASGGDGTANNPYVVVYE